MPHEELDPEFVNLLSKKTPWFAGLRGTRGTVARQLCEAGVGAAVNPTPVTVNPTPVTEVEEERLWSDTPKALLNAVLEKHFV